LECACFRVCVLPRNIIWCNHLYLLRLLVVQDRERERLWSPPFDSNALATCMQCHSKHLPTDASETPEFCTSVESPNVLIRCFTPRSPALKSLLTLEKKDLPATNGSTSCSLAQPQSVLQVSAELVLAISIHFTRWGPLSGSDCARKRNLGWCHHLTAQTASAKEASPTATPQEDATLS